MCFYAEKEKYEPEHDKTYNKACVTCKDSDQPVRLCSLISVSTVGFVVRWLIYFGYSLEAPQGDSPNEYYNICFCGEIRKIQSTLIVSNSKGLTEILRDIRNSTYQSWESEENNKLNNHI